MAKIDLIDSGWVDVVFEGKNQAYGAYQLRKNTGKGNLKAIIIMLATFAAIGLFVLGKMAYEASRPKVAITADVELSKLAQKKEPKVERKEPVKIEVEQKVVEKVKSSVKFVAPEIKKPIIELSWCSLREECLGDLMFNSETGEIITD